MATGHEPGERDDKADLRPEQYFDQSVLPGARGEAHTKSRTVVAPSLTTQQGRTVGDDQNTLRSGERGPALLEDSHFREKIFRFDHERVPRAGGAREGLWCSRLFRELRGLE